MQKGKGMKRKLFSLLLVTGLILTSCAPAEDPVHTTQAPQNASVRTPAEIVADIKVGWNLGNTLDATNTWTKPLTPTAQETAWGNPKTTQEMIDAVANAGFNTLRIPTTWYLFTGPAPDYTINEAWLLRVKEVVDYAFKNNMYVILNTHHETEWLIPTEEKYPEVSQKLKAIWTQIATYFKDYSDYLIFEGMNEPRVVGGENEWNGGTEENRLVINKLNRDFIDAVRTTGGNNTTRLLLITTQAASPTPIATSNFEFPEDEHYAVSLHAYTPYQFTFKTGEAAELFEWDGTQSKDIDSTLKNIQRVFLKRGIPVIITEFGAQNKGNEEEVVKWLKDYLTRANTLGIPCVWWDNGLYAGSGELFGLLDRVNLKWYSTAVLETLVK